MKPAIDPSMVHDQPDQMPMSGFRRSLRGLAGWLISLLIAFGLVSCSPNSGPPRSVVLDALSLQIELTQTSIAQSLDLPPMSGHPKVSRVRIEEQGTIKMDGRRGMHLQGQFDWQLPGDRFQVDSPFDLYLEQGEKQQSWRLAQPADAVADAGEGQHWLTYPLPLR